MLAFVTVAGLAQVSNGQVPTGPVPLAGTPVVDPQGAGRMSQARVIVMNKDPKAEAIPVALVNSPEPVRVALTGTPVVSVTGGVTAVTQSGVQRWEYRTVIVASDADVTTALNGLGGDGWEVSGAVVPRSNGAVGVILKRPR
jgi:hypothetical protein